MASEIVARGEIAGQRYAIFRLAPKNDRGNRYGIGFWSRGYGAVVEPVAFPYATIAEARRAAAARINACQEQ